MNWPFGSEDDETIRSEFPALEMVNVKSLDFPISTFPNEILDVASDMSGVVVGGGCTPVPERDTVIDPSLGSLLVMVNVEVTSL